MGIFGKRDIAILGVVRHGERPTPGVVVSEPCPVDEDEENRIMMGDG